MLNFIRDVGYIEDVEVEKIGSTMMAFLLDEIITKDFSYAPRKIRRVRAVVGTHASPT